MLLLLSLILVFIIEIYILSANIVDLKSGISKQCRPRSEPDLRQNCFDGVPF